MRRILLADDHPLIRDGISLLLRQLTPLGRVEIDTVENADSLWQQSADIHYDIVLMDLSMPGMVQRGGMNAYMSAFAAKLPVALLSGNATDATQREFRALGGRGVLHKTLSGQALLGALQLLLAGETYFPENRCAPPAESTPDLSVLSPRQQEIYGLLMQGQSNKVIARNLGLTLGTVKNYVHEIYRKLNINTRYEALSGGFDRQAKS